MSSDVAKEVDSFTNDKEEEDEFSFLDDDTVELGVTPKSVLPIQGEDEEIKEEASKKESDDTKVTNSMAEKEIKEDVDEEDVSYSSALAEEEDPEEKELMADVESDEPELTEEEIRQNLKYWKN